MTCDLTLELTRILSRTLGRKGLGILAPESRLTRRNQQNYLRYVSFSLFRSKQLFPLCFLQTIMWLYFQDNCVNHIKPKSWFASVIATILSGWPCSAPCLDKSTKLVISNTHLAQVCARYSSQRSFDRYRCMRSFHGVAPEHGDFKPSVGPNKPYFAQVDGLMVIQAFQCESSSILVELRLLSVNVCLQNMCQKI